MSVSVSVSVGEALGEIEDAGDTCCRELTGAESEDLAHNQSLRTKWNDHTHTREHLKKRLYSKKAPEMMPFSARG